MSSENAEILANLSRSISLVETAGAVEDDLAETLRAIATQDPGEAAARGLSLAEDAARGRAALGSVATAHDRAAWANERSARAGVVTWPSTSA